MLELSQQFVSAVFGLECVGLYTACAFCAQWPSLPRTFLLFFCLSFRARRRSQMAWERHLDGVGDTLPLVFFFLNRFLHAMRIFVER